MMDTMADQEPYVIHYPQIVAVASEDQAVSGEAMEFFDCVGGAMWSKLHYAQSPVVKDVRCVGSDHAVSGEIWHCGSLT